MKRLLYPLALAAALLTTPALAGPFTPGNLVVVRIGDGSAALTSAATAVFLLEYTPAGTLVQTVALPTVSSAPNRPLTASGSATSELNLTRSADGRYLVLAGYDASVGTAAIGSSPVATNDRIIGRVAANGTVDTSTHLTDAFDANNIRSATSADGSGFYAVGGNSGVRYVALGNTGGSVALTATPNVVNARSVGIFGGNLYAVSNSAATLGVSRIGTGLPTATGQTATILPGLDMATGSLPDAVFLADLSPAVPGVDVAYVADERTTAPGGLQKYSLVNGTWVQNGSILGAGTVAPVVRSVAGRVVGTAVTLLATSASAGLFVVTDVAGYNAAPSTTAFPAAVATPGPNTAFRGVAFAPNANAAATRAEAPAALLAAYPNPAQDVLTLYHAGRSLRGETAELLDLTGRLVRTTVLPASGELSVRGLPTGLYTLRVAGLTRRVAVQ